MRGRLIGVMVVLSVVAAACGGGTKTGAGASPTPTGGGAGDASAFLSLAKQGLTDNFKITLEVSGGTDDATSITWARRGEETSYRIAAGAESTLIIDRPGQQGVVSCSGNQCFTLPSGFDEGLAAGFLAPLLAFSESLGEAKDLPGFVSKGDATIAGRSASCATWNEFGSSVEVCVDVETGILLRWRGTDGAESMAWEVTDFGEPTDADFQPTGPVQSFPGG